MTVKTSRSTASYLIVFTDFTLFEKQSLRVDDADIADTMDAHYQRVTEAVRAADGRVIKFIGDASMLVFPEQAIDAAVRAIMELIASENRLMEKQGWDCRLQAKAHFGTVIAGEFGSDDNLRFDIFGRAVNATARLKPAGNLTLSADAYSKLLPDLQRRFTRQPAGGTFSV